MIELKITTATAAVLAATGDYFHTLAKLAGEPATVAAKAPIEAAALPLPAAELNNIDDEDDEPQAAVASLPPPPPTAGLAATVHALAQAGVELDSDGYPWDHRIHSSTKTKVKDGTWKLLRGADSALVAKVRGEFQQSAAAPVGLAPSLDQAPPMVPATAVEPTPTQSAPPPAPEAPAIAPAPVADAKPTNPAILFTTTLAMYAKATQAGLLPEGAGDAWAKQAGLASMSALITRPDLCGAFYDQLKALGV